MSHFKDRRTSIETWLENFEALKAKDSNLAILLISELSREGLRPKESNRIEYTGDFLIKLESKNLSDKEIESFGDDNKRTLYLELARDVQGNITIANYEINFRQWKFEELT